MKCTKKNALSEDMCYFHFNYYATNIMTMKRSFPSAFFILLLFLFSSSLSGQQGTYSQYLDHLWVDSVLSSLSVEEKIAQSLWLITDPDEGLYELMESARAISDHGLGGLIFTTSPMKRCWKWQTTAVLSAIYPWPLHRRADGAANPPTCFPWLPFPVIRYVIWLERNWENNSGKRVCLCF